MITEAQYRERMTGLAIMECGGGNKEWIDLCRKNLETERSEAKRLKRTAWQRLRGWLTGPRGPNE